MVMSMTQPIKLSPRSKLPLPISIIREISVAASVDPVTVKKCLKGGVPRGMPASRIRAELERRGLLHLAPGLAAQASEPSYMITCVGSR